MNGLGEDVAAESWILRTGSKGKDGRALSTFFNAKAKRLGQVEMVELSKGWRKTRKARSLGRQRERESRTRTETASERLDTAGMRFVDY